MFESSLPLRKFFSECLHAAERSGYEIILCLVAREGDAPEIYEEVTRYWSSLHDLTGEGVLFVFAGPQEGELARGGVRHRREPVYYTASGISVAPGSKLAFDMWRELHEGTPAVHRKLRLPERHSLEVSDLKALFDLREADLPCLHVTFLRDMTTTALKLERKRGLSFYSYIRAIMAEAEPYVAELRSLSGRFGTMKDKSLRLKRTSEDPHIRATAAVSNVAYISQRQDLPKEAKDVLTEIVSILRETESNADQRPKYFRLLEKLKQDSAFWRNYRAELQRAIDLKSYALNRLPEQTEALEVSLKETSRQIEQVSRELKDSILRAANFVSNSAPVTQTSFKADVCLLTVIEPELEAAKAVLGLADRHRVKLPSTGSVYWTTKVFSRRANRDYTVAVGCIANAGNYDSAAAASEALFAFSPRCMLLVGIAAGIKGKVKLGQVVFSQRVVSYEPASLERNDAGATTEVRRPEIVRIGHSIHQDVTAYQGWQAHDRVRGLCRVFKQQDFPDAKALESLGVSENDVAESIEIAPSTIASGEKLLRDENKLRAIRKNIHGKTEVGEMEAAGFVTACLRSRVDWLVIRGICDFGDPLKSDHFHNLASMRAAATAADFLSHGLEIVPSR